MASGKRELSAYGKLVRKKLVDKNMTQAELADQIGSTHQYLSDVLHGKRSGTKYQDRINLILGIDS